MINLLTNSSLAICTQLPLRRIGNKINITGWDSPSAGIARLYTPNTEGLYAGKLVLIEGAATPHAPHVGLVADGQTPNQLTQRIYGPVGSFTGLEVGDVADITGGTNTMSRGKYTIKATDANRYIDLFYPVAPFETGKTYDITYYQGSKDVAQQLNGLPAIGAPETPSVIGYPLMVTEVGAGYFLASLAGDVTSLPASGTAIAWEVSPGMFAVNNGAACDGWAKSPSLEVYREYLKDTDLNDVTIAGENWGFNLKSKAPSGQEYFYSQFVKPDNDDLLTEYKGKTLTFGAYTKAGAANHAKLILDDGVTTVLSSYTSNGVFEWHEITLTVDANASYINVGWQLDSSVDVVTHVTQPMLVIGDSIGEGNYVRTRGIHHFANHPNCHRKFVNGSITANQNIKMYQESLGMIPRGIIKGIYSAIEGHNSSVAFESWLRVGDKFPGLTLPSIILYAQVANKYIANNGYVPLGRINGIDVMSIEVGNGTWTGVNLDMFACEL